MLNNKRVILFTFKFFYIYIYIEIWGITKSFNLSHILLVVDIKLVLLISMVLHQLKVLRCSKILVVHVKKTSMTVSEATIEAEGLKDF